MSHLLLKSFVLSIIGYIISHYASNQINNRLNYYGKSNDIEKILVQYNYHGDEFFTILNEDESSAITKLKKRVDRSNLRTIEDIEDYKRLNRISKYALASKIIFIITIIFLSIFGLPIGSDPDLEAQ
ncbi:hypothetical protein KGF54_003037 [Candida jiufengensis]|uniref:uncharacterized protein n=1 Tax=Candida jiufengensis TaxID=497108 RepID=UPI002224EECA|nr:uncharacterized protein KGF54_003037 [Candida jiufengensis]KAI5953665.1 hypothetical protein KGF54_003037 [Candida jiufengensis]